MVQALKGPRLDVRHQRRRDIGFGRLADLALEAGHADGA
jgi:hypothetical protein